MKVGFDLDGTLDKEGVAALARALFSAGHEVHVISGMFQFPGNEWQDRAAKERKLRRHGIKYTQLHIIDGLPFGGPSGFPIDVILRDIGLRKGALADELGLDLMFDDSEQYIGLMRAFCGATLVQVR